MAGSDGQGFYVYVSKSVDSTIVVLSVKSAAEPPEIVQTVEIVPGAKGGGMSTPMALAPDGRALHAAIRLPPLPVTTSDPTRTMPAPGSSSPSCRSSSGTRSSMLTRTAHLTFLR